jgi:hypothetical protein
LAILLPKVSFPSRIYRRQHRPAEIIGAKMVGTALTP